MSMAMLAAWPGHQVLTLLASQAGPTDRDNIMADWSLDYCTHVRYGSLYHHAQPPNQTPMNPPAAVRGILSGLK